MGSCVSTRAIDIEDGIEMARKKGLIGRQPPVSARVHPVRRNRVQFLNDNNDDVSIDNLPWEGDDAIL